MWMSIWKGSHKPILRGLMITMVINHLLTGMILQVGDYIPLRLVKYTFWKLKWKATSKNRFWKNDDFLFHMGDFQQRSREFSGGFNISIIKNTLKIQVCPMGKLWNTKSYSFRMGLEPKKSYAIGRCGRILRDNSYLWTPRTHGKMRFKALNIWVVTPKWRKRGFPW